jgi:hypothetical protein
VGVLIDIQTPSGHAWGLLTLATIDQSEWQITINEVPRVAEFCYGDLVMVDARGATTTSGPRLFLRIVERGQFAPSVCVAHTLDAAAVEAWLEELEAAGWASRDDEGGKVWLAAPSNVDARAVLARPFVISVSPASRQDTRR